MFDDFVKEVKENYKPEKEVEIDVFKESPIFNPEYFKDKLMNLDLLSDKELYELLKTNYETLLSDLFVKNTKEWKSLFMNSRILTSMIQVMSSLTGITHNNRIYCNKIAYDYLTSEYNDKYIKQLMFTLSKTVNKDIIPGLLGVGIPEDLACYMALSRYSSLKELINIQRLNFIIVSSSKELMTEQMIVWIYEKLFNNFTMLFEGVMFDVNIDDLTDEMQEIYSTISLAILDILDNMPSTNIMKVLTTYLDDYYALHSDKGYRFSMKSLSNDYQRVRNVVEILEQQNIYIP